MRKYFLFFFAFGFGILSFLMLGAQSNTAFALKAGDRCYIAQGCGSTTLACIADGKCHNVGFITRCNDTGICKQKATSGSCTKNSDCASGSTCLKTDPSCVPDPLRGKSCPTSCQVQKIGQGQVCQGSGQGNCAAGYTCQKDSNQCSGTGIAQICKSTCQKQPTKGGQCTVINGKDSCGGNTQCDTSNNTCPQTPGRQCGVCKAKPTKGGQCTVSTTSGTPSGNCGGNLICDTSNNTCPQTPGIQCGVCTQKTAKEGDTCTGTGQGTCSDASLVCTPQQCAGIACPSKCQKPNSPTAVPTLPPPPSPPCKHWSSTGECELTNSAFGDLATNPSYFLKTIFSIMLSVSGGIALLLIIRSGYQLMTSQGRPEQIQQGRDQLVAAIVGLSFLIFSFVLLQVIGYDILRIPGFGK